MEKTKLNEKLINIFSSYYYLYPKNIVWLLGYGVVRLLLYLPYSALMSFGEFLGGLAYILSSTRRKITEINIQHSFPELDDPQQTELVKKVFTSTGASLFELALADWASTQKLKNLYEVKGLEHLQNALKHGKGVILLTAHFTMVELAARLLSFNLEKKLAGIYRPYKNPILEKLTARTKYQYFNPIPKQDIRQALKRLRQNEVILYAPDQNFDSKILFVPFFGIQTATSTATIRLTQLSQAQLVPFFFFRLPDHQGYRLEIHPALNSELSGDIYKDTCLINQTMEQAIRKHPEQYLWIHRRFKTRPLGEAPFYI
jgi:Kdo2-lipid IVA lauroyltransferase/acyltransferase